MRLWSCLLGLFMMSDYAQALESNRSMYRDFSNQSVSLSESCGSLCIIDQNYVERIRLEEAFASRGFSQAVITRPSSIQSFNGDYIGPYMSLSFKTNSMISKAVLERQIRWANMARDVGIGVSERGRSFQSALWREVRRPLLNEARDWALAPYRSKKLTREEKLEAWLIEQSVDSGAGVLDLEATSPGGFSPTNMDFGISDYTLKYRPRVDPMRGRYGVRVRYKKYLSASRPFFADFGFHYCNPSMGLGRSRCAYLHELSGRVSMMSMTRHVQMSLFMSYQTETLDQEALRWRGEIRDHKPWLGGLQLTYAFYK